ncbi:MAG: hypothetical protein FWD36_04910 [Treponema sp.]|nr:hypothetical protein [Treponema sp.]
MTNNRNSRSFPILILLFVLGSGFAGAQASGDLSRPHDWWYTLEQGKLRFRQGDYSSALIAFDDARRQRLAMYERMERDLIHLLSISEVRRIGDSLEWIERYIHDRRHDAVAAALAELYYRIPKESLDNSAAAALKALGTLKDYPEAEYWIGEVYLLEGELPLAMTQFKKALDLRELHENPGLVTDLLYKIAAICNIRQEYNEMESVLISILSADKMFSGNDYARTSMTRILENNGINRFLTMYRYNNTELMEAHRLLGYYYFSRGRHSKAQEHFMFAFLIQNTVVIEEITRSRPDFSFTALEGLIAEINRRPHLTDYAEKNEYFKIAYYLGASLYGNGKTSTARELWHFLAAQNNADEWQTRSITQLRNPRIRE